MSFTKLYLTSRAAPFTPTNYRGSWNDTLTTVTHALEPVKSHGGAITSVSRDEISSSNTHSCLLYRGVSGPLTAQTISGTIDVVLGVRENSTDADFAYHLHVYVTQGDSDTVRGTLINDYVETTANEWPTTATGRALASAQTLSSLAISDGDRLVVEIGFRALNTITALRTGTLNYGTEHPSDLSEVSDLTAASIAVTTLAGFISLSNSVTEPVLETRVSQLAAEEVNAGTHELRVSQLAAEEINAGSREARISQIAAEEINSGIKEARISQIVLEAIAANFVGNQRMSQFCVEILSPHREDQNINVFIAT